MMDTTHFCHIRHCGQPVPPEMFACSYHWFMVPADIRREIWRHYRKGQENDKNPSERWMEAAKKAQAAVERREFEKCLQNHGAACGCWATPKNPAVAQRQLL